jgi:hypothetical protein
LRAGLDTEKRVEPVQQISFFAQVLFGRFSFEKSFSKVPNGAGRAFLFRRRAAAGTNSGLIDWLRASRRFTL